MLPSLRLCYLPTKALELCWRGTDNVYSPQTAKTCHQRGRLRRPTAPSVTWKRQANVGPDSTTYVVDAPKRYRRNTMEQLARPLDDMNRAGRTLTGHARSRQCRELVDCPGTSLNFRHLTVATWTWKCVVCSARSVIRVQYGFGIVKLDPKGPDLGEIPKTSSMPKTDGCIHRRRAVVVGVGDSAAARRVWS